MASTFTVERSTTIAAPATAIYPLLADFKEWPRWSPWEKLDPEMEHVYEGADSGVGAVHRWKGNKKAGEGVAEVTSADEPSEVVLRLQFLKPFKSDNTVTYTLAPDGDGTRVSWRMDGPLNLFMRVFTLVKPMDSMVGKDFEEGLANLKREAEALT
ncbi:MAG: SRPBCC family protein [Baekduia sp.]